MSKLPSRDTRKALSPTAEAWLEVLRVVGPILISAITAIWIAFQYFQSAAKDREQALETREKEQKQTEREVSARISEARKPFNQLQLATYEEIATVAGVLATAQQGDPTYTDAKRNFYKLYWSRLSMVEDGKVEVAMVNLERAIRNYAARTRPQQNVRVRVYCLANALKASIQQSWTITLPDTPKLPKIDESNRRSCEAEETLVESATKIEQE